MAEAANWSRQNADVLKDTHWVGGDPAWLSVYGWASWTPRKAILVLRNPSDKAQSIRIDLGKALELRPGAAPSYSARSPWKADQRKSPRERSAPGPHEFNHPPVQAITL